MNRSSSKPAINGQRGVLVAVTDPVSPEREIDYHAWYNEVQIPPFLSMPEVRRVVRYKSSSTQLDPQTAVPHGFIALYDIDTAQENGLSAFADKQYAAYERGIVGNKSPRSDAYEQSTSRAIYYAQIGERAGRPLDAEPPSALFMVYSEPESQAQEDEFNHWYSTDHISDVLRVPGFVAATRYILTDLNVGRQFNPWPVPRRYLAAYELDAKGPEAIQETLRALRSRDNPTRSTALGTGDRYRITQCYERIAGPFFSRSYATKAG